MSRRARSIVAVVSSTLLAAGLLAGCASGGGAASSSPSDGTTEPAAMSAAWLDGGSMIALVIPGSSTCVPSADEVEVADGVLSVTLVEPAADTACTRDLVPRGIPVQLPAGIDPAEDLEIVARGEGFAAETVLAGVEGLEPGTGLDGGMPSAGWAGPGTFALLTWGSSGCPPELDDAAVSEGEIAVTFATPPADRACTLDMAARVTIVEVADAVAGESYDALLSGDVFDGVRVPIAGTP